MSRTETGTTSSIRVRRTLVAAAGCALSVVVAASSATPAQAASSRASSSAVVETGALHTSATLTYRCQGTSRGVSCSGTDTTGASAWWTVVRTGTNSWTGAGRAGHTLLHWTTKGTAVGSWDGFNSSARHLETQGQVTDLRGEDFAYYWGGYVPGGSTSGSSSLHAILVCQGSGAGGTPALGTDCRAVQPTTLPQLVVMTPVYPGADLTAA